MCKVTMEHYPLEMVKKGMMENYQMATVWWVAITVTQMVVLGMAKRVQSHRVIGPPEAELKGKEPLEELRQKERYRPETV